jgi:hypothetical protein
MRWGRLRLSQPQEVTIPLDWREKLGCHFEKKSILGGTLQLEQRKNVRMKFH